MTRSPVLLRQISLRALAGSSRQRHNAGKYQHTGDERRQSIAVLRLNADLCVANLHVVVFLVRYWNYKRQQSKHKQDCSQHAQTCHIAPSLRSCARVKIQSDLSTMLANSQQICYEIGISWALHSANQVFAVAQGQRRSKKPVQRTK